MVIILVTLASCETPLANGGYCIGLDTAFMEDAVSKESLQSCFSSRCDKSVVLLLNQLL